MLKIVGCGDLMIANKMPEKYEGFNDLRSFLLQHDIRFGNLETTIHNNEGYPSAFPGGGYAMAAPTVLDDIKRFGFNLINIANNHMLDYSHKGLAATLGYLNERDLTYAGAGMNLTEASAPRYLEVENGRVALIAATSSFHDSDAAGNQSVNMLGRPGVNPLRHVEILQVTSELLDAVREISTLTGINAYRDLGAKNGYVLQSENVKLRDVLFKEGDDVRKISYPKKNDVERIVHSVKEAKTQADCVIVSLHGHQLGKSDNYPDDFMVEFCHEVVDAGANIVFCHGSHVIRGIEKRKDSVIFYGLGDFIMKNEVQNYLPADFYEKYEIPYQDYGTVGMAMDVRSKNNTIGMCSNPKVWESFIPSIEFDINKQKICSVKLYPITLHYDLPRSRRGWPELSEDAKVIKELAQISEEYGTIIDENHELVL
jgi:poly-gamma-glutamate synthesis protein (capsule biosynthesis protein)